MEIDPYRGILFFWFGSILKKEFDDIEMACGRRQLNRSTASLFSILFSFCKISHNTKKKMTIYNNTGRHNRRTHTQVIFCISHGFYIDTDMVIRINNHHIFLSHKKDKKSKIFCVNKKEFR